MPSGRRLWNERRDRTPLASALGGLPSLPAHGLARETKAGVQLQTMAGKPLATVPGLDLAPDNATAHGLVVRDGRGRLFVLDREARRVRRAYELPSRVPGCRLTDARGGFDLLVCGRTIKSVAGNSSYSVVVRGPGIRIDPRARHLCRDAHREATADPAHAALRAVPDVGRLVPPP